MISHVILIFVTVYFYSVDMIVYFYEWHKIALLEKLTSAFMRSIKVKPLRQVFKTLHIAAESSNFSVYMCALGFIILRNSFG